MQSTAFRSNKFFLSSFMDTDDILVIFFLSEEAIKFDLNKNCAYLGKHCDPE